MGPRWGGALIFWWRICFRILRSKGTIASAVRVVALLVPGCGRLLASAGVTGKESDADWITLGRDIWQRPSPEEIDMSTNARLIALLVVLVLVESISLYQTLFSVWMMAYPDRKSVV